MRSNPSISFVATGSVELLDESTPITSITLRPSEGSYRLYDLNIWVECLTRGTKSTDDDAKQEEGNLDGARKQSSLDKLFGATNAQPSPHAFDYEVQFDNESLGLVIHETQSLPVVEENNSGLPKPFEGDLVSVVAGVDLMLHQEPYQTAIALVKSNPRPLKIGFVHSDRKKQESEVELLENLQTSTSSDLIIPGHDGTNETVATSILAGIFLTFFSAPLCYFDPRGAFSYVFRPLRYFDPRGASSYFFSPRFATSILAGLSLTFFSAPPRCFDPRGASIDGEVEGWFTDDTVKRFEAYGWQVIPRVNGHDAEEIHQAIATAKANTDQPTLICCKTIIGFGSPNKEGKEDCHGAPLGDDEIALTRARLGWTAAPFEIPTPIKSAWDAQSPPK